MTSSASASYDRIILWRKIDLPIALTSSGITKALLFKKAWDLAAFDKNIDALGDAP